MTRTTTFPSDVLSADDCATPCDRCGHDIGAHAVIDAPHALHGAIYPGVRLQCPRVVAMACGTSLATFPDLAAVVA